MKEDTEPPRYDLSVTLRLWHDDPRDLGGLLQEWGFEPGGGWQAGEPARAPNGRQLERLRRDSYAYVQLRLPDVGWFAQAIASIVDSLEPVRTGLRAFVDAGGRAELYAYWHFHGNSGDTLDWRLARRLADFGLDLALDIYPPPRGQTLDSAAADEALA